MQRARITHQLSVGIMYMRIKSIFVNTITCDLQKKLAKSSGRKNTALSMS